MFKKNAAQQRFTIKLTKKKIVVLTVLYSLCEVAYNLQATTADKKNSPVTVKPAVIVGFVFLCYYGENIRQLDL